MIAKSKANECNVDYYCQTHLFPWMCPVWIDLNEKFLPVCCDCVRRELSAMTLALRAMRWFVKSLEVIFFVDLSLFLIFLTPKKIYSQKQRFLHKNTALKYACLKNVSMRGFFSRRVLLESTKLQLFHLGLFISSIQTMRYILAVSFLLLGLSLVYAAEEDCPG